MADEQLIKPRELPAAATVFANDAIMTDDGVTVGKATPVQIVNAGAPVPTEAEAIAGADNSKRMTPLTVKQVLDSVTAPSVLRAAAWAESSTPPDPGIPGSKSAKSWASESERLGREQADRAEAAAAQAALYDGIWLNNLSDLTTDTALTYTSGSASSVTAGQTLNLRDGSVIAVASTGATDQHGTTAGGVKYQIIAEPNRVITSTPSGWIGRGATIAITLPDGSQSAYRAVRTFLWSGLLAALFKPSSDLIRVSDMRARSGDAPVPASFEAPPFDVRIDGDRITTSLDQIEDYRAEYSPDAERGWTFYCDPAGGDNTNDGTSWGEAKRTLSGSNGIRALINSSGNPNKYPVRVYVQGGHVMPRDEGLYHSELWEPDFSLIAVGEPLILGNLYRSSDVTFTENSTYAWVYEHSTIGSATTVMTMPDRVFDRRLKRIIAHPQTGRVWTVPTEYSRLSSLAAVADHPGSYWFDTENSKFYIHCVGGDSPEVGTNILINRSSIDIIISAKHTYFENIIFIGGVTFRSFGGTAYAARCLSLGSQANGWSFNNLLDCGSFEALSVDPVNDGFNYHATGVNVIGMTNANPVVVTTSSNHGLTTGTEVMFYAPPYAASSGMTEILGLSGTVTSLTSTTFAVDIDSSGFSAYVPPGTGQAGYKASPPNPRFHEIRPYSTGAGVFGGVSEQSSSAHENFEGWTVDPYFEQAFRDNITDVDDATRVVWGGTLLSPRENASTRQLQLLTTGRAKMAVYGSMIGGVVAPDTHGRIVYGAGVHPILILNCDLPSGGGQWYGCAEWA